MNLLFIVGSARSVHPRAAARGGEGEGMMDDDLDPTARPGGVFARKPLLLAARIIFPHFGDIVLAVS